ncbi:MAG TPA: alginate lyase family protein, partial [Telluria sp.]|nr:alginate lyase family protein [Telluria sp.]
VGMLEKRGWLDADASMIAAPRQPARHGPPPLLPGEAAALLRDADRICAGHVTLFAGRGAHVGALPEWNRDPATGILAPAIFYRDIDVTDRAQVGDIKHLWELNRHLHLVRLAQAASFSADPVYLRTLAAQLRGWLDQCPPRVGPNWCSALELGIRLINWSLIWHVLGGDAGALFSGAAGQQLRADWLRSIHAHCRHITRHLSRHSSANNHLIGELAGLYVGAVTWPCWHASQRWRTASMAQLEQQAALQFSRDGVNREQAFAYHRFSTELLIVAGLAGAPFSPDYWEVVRRALRFLRSVRDAGGHVPMVGDADDASVFRLGPAGAHWLRHALPGEHPDLGADTGWSFPDGGYLLFGARFGAPDEIKGMVDCGPLGYLGIAAHGHADALAITLSVAGEQCLVDPGTWSYWQAPAWRDYFRGTSAHNTVRVDGVDQSVSGGRFMWLRKAVARIERMPQSPADFDFRGSHDGYLRLADPVRHVRSVRFDGATLVVRDELTATRPHLLEQFWHFAPGLVVALNAGGVKVRGSAFEMELEVSGDGLTLELVRGAADPPLGWYSPSYETKQPCKVLKITTLSNAVPVECRFTIEFSNDVRF